MSTEEAQVSSARPLLLRQMNARTVLDMIRERGPVSRAEIARIAGISKPTVSLALRALLEAGLVRETEPGDKDGPTYGAIFFEADPEAAAVLGIDIGGRYLRMALADVTGAVRAREDVESSYDSKESVFKLVPAVARRLIRQTGVRADRVACATVGVPGVVEPGSGLVGPRRERPGARGAGCGQASAEGAGGSRACPQRRQPRGDR